MPAITATISDLQNLNENPGSFECKLFEELGRKATHYRNVKITDTEVLRASVKKTRKDFISNLISNLEKRFPQESTNLVNAFSVLALRGVNFDNNLNEWGNEKLDTLITFYGNAEYVDAQATKAEWSTLKRLVIDQRYPTGHLDTLWPIIHQHHKDMFPNLVKLASIAMVLPVHTADVERGFSAQNMVKTHLRNRIKAETLQNLLVIKIEGPPMAEFDFQSALSIFNKKKDRRLYHIQKPVKDSK